MKTFWFVVAGVLLGGLLLAAFLGISGYILYNEFWNKTEAVRIDGAGSQLDHSGGMPFARANVHDNEPANSAGYFDRTVINSDDPSDIGMGDDFSIPDGWKVERDYSMLNSKFVPYMTVKPPVDISNEEIREWAQDNELEGYKVTSVVVTDGQECSMPGLDENRVRVNIYVGENWTAQFCPVK